MINQQGPSFSNKRFLDNNFQEEGFILSNLKNLMLSCKKAAEPSQMVKVIFWSSFFLFCILFLILLLTIFYQSSIKIDWDSVLQEELEKLEEEISSLNFKENIDLMKQLEYTDQTQLDPKSETTQKLKKNWEGFQKIDTDFSNKISNHIEYIHSIDRLPLQKYIHCKTDFIIDNAILFWFAKIKSICKKNDINARSFLENYQRSIFPEKLQGIKVSDIDIYNNYKSTRMSYIKENIKPLPEKKAGEEDLSHIFYYEKK